MRTCSTEADRLGELLRAWRLDILSVPEPAFGPAWWTDRVRASPDETRTRSRVLGAEKDLL